MKILSSTTNAVLDRRDTPLSDATEGEYTFEGLTAGDMYRIILSVIPISMVENRELASINATATGELKLEVWEGVRVWKRHTSLLDATEGSLHL